MQSTPAAQFERLALDPSNASAAEVEARLGDAARVQSWVASREAALINRAAQLNTEGTGVDPEDAVREQQRTSSSGARKKARRANAAAKTPALDNVMAEGATTPKHVDALANAASDLDPAQKDQLFDLANQQPSAAVNLSVDSYRRHLATLVDKIRRDEGLDRLAEQVRNTKLRTWVNAKTGM